VFLVLGLTWPVAIVWCVPGTLEHWWIHTFVRAFSNEAMNSKPVWYYATSLPWQLLPWTLCVCLAWPASLQRARDASAQDRFLWLWFALPLLTLTAMKGKHHHYLIHALPPCALWAAEGLLHLRDRRWLHDRWPWVSLFVLALAGLGAGLAITERGRFAAFQSDVVVLGSALVIGVLLTGWAHRQGRYRLAAVALFGLV